MGFWAGSRLPRGLARVPLTLLGWLADTGATRLLWGLERVQEHGDAPPHQPFATTPSTPAATQRGSSAAVRLADISSMTGGVAWPTVERGWPVNPSAATRS